MHQRNLFSFILEEEITKSYETIRAPVLFLLIEFPVKYKYLKWRTRGSRDLSYAAIFRHICQL